MYNLSLNLSALPRELGLTAASDFKVVFIFEDANAVASVETSYLKLNALIYWKSSSLRSLNLNGAFLDYLHNVAWEGNNPIELDWLRANELNS